MCKGHLLALPDPQGSGDSPPPWKQALPKQKDAAVGCRAQRVQKVFWLLAGTTSSPQGRLAPSSSSCSRGGQGCRCSARKQQNIILG